MAAYEVPDIKNVYFDDFVKTLPSMAGKRVAITGCTSGTGFITAKVVAQAGGSVVMINRPSARAEAAEQQIREAAPGAEVITVPCDLQSMKSVAGVASQFQKSFPEGGLDVLVTNAGVMALPDKATEDSFDVQMQTNHLAHFVLVRDLMPELEKAAAAKGEARVVHATSNARNIPVSNGGAGLKEEYFGKNGGNLGGDGGAWQRYGQSKMANAAFHYALHDKLQAKGSKVLSILTHPGLAATNLQATTSAHDESGAKGQNLTNMMKDSQSADDGTMPMLLGVCSPAAKSGDFYAPKDNGVIGPGTKGEAVKIEPEEHHTTPDVKDSIWKWSEAAVGSFAI